jgi:hypothetical protein
VTVVINYITTNSRRRRLDDEDEDVDVEISSDVDLHGGYNPNADIPDASFEEYVDATAFQRLSRGLQSVLHTVVMYKLNVMRLFMDDVLADEEYFDAEMLTRLTQAIENDVQLIGYSVVMVEFPAPEPSWTNATAVECPEVIEVDDGLKPLELVGIVFLGITGMLFLVVMVLGVKMMRDSEMACFKKREKKEKIKPSYVTQVDALTDQPEDSALALAGDPTRSSLEIEDDNEMKISNAAESDFEAMSNVEQNNLLDTTDASLALDNNQNPSAIDDKT